MLKKSVATLVLCLGIVCCAAPTGVPRGANVEFNPVAGPSGLVWNWQRTVEHGCADFSGGEGSPAVRVSVDPAKCEGRDRTFVGCEACGPGLLYYADNYMVFQNYWPWTSDDFLNGLIFDSNGMGIGVRPCPHSLSPEQLAALQVVAREALAQATTDSERRTLERIDQILAATNGAALVSGQYGCMPEIDRGVSPEAES